MSTVRRIDIYIYVSRRVNDVHIVYDIAHDAVITSIAMSDLSTIVTGSKDHTIKRWSFDEDANALTCEGVGLGHLNSIDSVAVCYGNNNNNHHHQSDLVRRTHKNIVHQVEQDIYITSRSQKHKNVESI